MKKISTKLIKKEYERLGSIWKAAESLGISGQTVHRRLVAAGVDTSLNVFSKEDKKRLIEDYSLYREEKMLDYLAMEMGRTKQFICRQAGKLGLTKNKKRGYYKLEISGKKFGRLTAIRETGKKIDGCFEWLFLCDCGNEIRRKASLVSGGFVMSCGCLHRDRTSKASTTHGLSKSRVYKIYNGMISRCKHKSRRDFKWYGEKELRFATNGRGVLKVLLIGLQKVDTKKILQ